MQYTNALIHEKSPYLLQHAHNPVDWLPWGDDAFERARREDKPVLVSIGYSTCHWCHVMERESFEDEDIARLLNEAFICVKVDREERPDVDSVYMTVCNLLTGSGGWPLNVVLTPDRKPFFAATYIPPSARGGRLGLDELIPRITDAWKTDRQKVMDVSENITENLVSISTPAPSSDGLPDGRRLARLVHGSLSSGFDSQYGGFGSAPKFPSPHNLLFLLRHGRLTGSEEPASMAFETLAAMRRGGVWDHVGFGFHRYATDRMWLLPHFEKMLYDQAMLALAYLEAYQLSGNDEFAETARRIFTYVLRDLRDPSGGFHTAEDADSEGEEGLFHTWTLKEIESVLSPEESAAFCKHYNILQEGNFRDEATGELTGRNIPHESDVSPVPAELLEIARKKLFTEREKRIRPHLDDKILTDMNGLMIAALARGGRVLGQPEYTDAAKKAAEFVLDTLSDGNGALRHGYREGVMNAPGTLDDHAYMLWGLLELHNATFDNRMLEQALLVARNMIDSFEDEERGGFHLSSRDSETVLVRQKDSYDGALPCGNSVAVHTLYRLSRMLRMQALRDAATRCATAFSGILKQQPQALVHMVGALELMQHAETDIVVAGKTDSEATRELLKSLAPVRPMSTTVIFVPIDEPDLPTALPDPAPYKLELEGMDAEAAAWVCIDKSCRRPVTSPEELREQLSKSVD